MGKLMRVNKKYIRQAQLPEGAYAPEVSSICSFVKPKDGEYVRCEGITEHGQCIKNVSPLQIEFSMKKYKKVVCFSCQHNGLNDVPSGKGFAAMNPNLQRKIAEMGGKASFNRHKFTHDEAIAAGKAQKKS